MKRKLMVLVIGTFALNSGALRADLADQLEAEEDLQNEALVVAIDMDTEEANAAYRLSGKEVSQFKLLAKERLKSESKNEKVAKSELEDESVASHDKWLKERKNVLNSVEFDPDNNDVATPAHYRTYYGVHWELVKTYFLVAFHGGYYWAPAYYYRPYVLARTVHVMYRKIYYW